jgi:hypothetical protein
MAPHTFRAGGLALRRDQLLMARDDFGSGVKLRLAQRVNYCCSNPACRVQTSGPTLASDASINVGIAAHITAASIGGPRFDASLSPKERGSIGNGMWLCQTCAKLVDSDELRFTAPTLRSWKKHAEALALENLGVRMRAPALTTDMGAVHGKLMRESNPRFGFSFLYPILWDRQDPTNSDGNTYRHPRDPRVEMRVWGGYAVVSPDLYSWVEWTLGHCQKAENYRLVSRVPSGGHLIDWEHRLGSEPLKTRQQIEGERVVYQAEECGEAFTCMRTFLQFGGTQFAFLGRAPTSLYPDFEELFWTMASEFRILGTNVAPYARAGKVRHAELLWHRMVFGLARLWRRRA